MTVVPAEQLARLQARFVRPDLRVSSRLRSDGIRTIELAGGMQHAMIAVRAPDGQVQTTCVDTPEAAARVMDAAPSRAVAP